MVLYIYIYNIIIYFKNNVVFVYLYKVEFC